MGDRSQILKTMTLLLKRIIRGTCTLHYNFICLDLERLLCLRCRYERSLYDYCCSYEKVRNAFYNTYKH